MKLNISYPAGGGQKGIDIDDDKKMWAKHILLSKKKVCNRLSSFTNVWISRQFYDKQISQEISGDVLGDQWKGYILKIMGGNDKEGFPMMQGVLTNTRVRLLLGKRKH